MMNRSRRFSLRITCGAWLPLAMLLCGCGGADGPETAPAGGVVLINGEPIEGATVTYQPVDSSKGSVSTGVTDAEGRFTLTMGNGKPGAVLGEHKVGIMKVEQVGGPDIQPEAGGEMPDIDESKIKFNWIVPQSKSDPSISGLTATVSADDENQETFDLQK